MLHALPYTAQGLAQSAPIYDAQGTAFVGASRHVLLGINVATGHVQQQVSGDDSGGSQCSSLAVGGQDTGEGASRSDLLWLKQRHSSVRAVETVFDADTGAPRAVDVWNVSVSAPQLGEVHGRLAVDRHSGQAEAHSLRALEQCMRGGGEGGDVHVALQSTTGGSLLASASDGRVLWSQQLGSPVATASRFDVCTLRGGRHLLLPATAHSAPVDVEGTVEALAQGGSFSVLSQVAVEVSTAGQNTEHPALFIGQHSDESVGRDGMASLFALPMAGAHPPPGAEDGGAVSTGVALWTPAVDTHGDTQSLAEHSVHSLVQGACDAEGCEHSLTQLPAAATAPPLDAPALLRRILGTYSPHTNMNSMVTGDSALVPYYANSASGDGDGNGFLIPLPPDKGDQGGQRAQATPPKPPADDGASNPSQVHVRVHSAAQGDNDSVSWSLVPLPPTGGLQPAPDGDHHGPSAGTNPTRGVRPVLLMDGQGGLLQAYLWLQEGGAAGGSLQYLGGRVAGHVEVVWSPAFTQGAFTGALQSLGLGDDEGGVGGGRLQADAARAARRASSQAVGMAANVQLELLQQHLMTTYGSVVTLVAPAGIHMLLSLPWPLSALGRLQAREHVGGVLFPHAGTALLPAEGAAVSRDIGDQAALATVLLLMLGVAGGVMWLAFRHQPPPPQDTKGQSEETSAATPPTPLVAPIETPRSPTSPPLTPLEVVKGGITYRSVDAEQELLVSETLLGKGSHGTRVYAGMLKKRPVAVKQMLRSFFDMASREVDLLIRSDGHAGIVRYYASRSAGDFVYLALERCSCTLGQAVQATARRRAALAQRYAAYMATRKGPKGGKGGSSGKEGKAGGGSYVNPFSEAFLLEDGPDEEGGGLGAGAVAAVSGGALPVPVPSDGTRAFLHSLASGVAHLHGACRIVHRDLKPGNILLAPKGGKGGLALQDTEPAAGCSDAPPAGDAVWYAECHAWGAKWAPKISDMGLGKQLGGGSTAGSSVGGKGGGDASSGRLLRLQGGGASYSTEGGAGAPGTVGWQAPEILRVLYGGIADEWTPPPTPPQTAWPEGGGGNKKRPLTELSPVAVVEHWARDSACWLPPGPAALLRGKAVAKGPRAAVLALAPHIQRMLHMEDEGAGGGGASLEELLSAARTRAVDVWALGCVLYHVLDAGGHPFGGELTRQARILGGEPSLARLAHIPEAQDLLRGMLARHAPARPRAALAAEHCFFWPDARRCEFLKELSDRLDEEAAGSAVLAAADALTPAVCGEGGWHRRLPKRLLAQFTERRAYDYGKLTHLLRVFRNQRNHYRDLSAEALQQVLRGGGADASADVPSALYRFFTAPVRFPRLLLAAHALARWFFAHEPEFAAVLGKETAGMWAPVSTRQYVRVQSEPNPPAAGAAAGAGAATATKKAHITPAVLQSEQTAWLPSEAEFAGVVAAAVAGSQDCRVWVLERGAGGAGGVPVPGSQVRLTSSGQPVQQDGGAVKPVTCAWSGLKKLHTKFGGGANSASAKYKCALCSDWAGNKGHCGRGVRCDFAHGPMEVTTRQPLWPSAGGAGPLEWQTSLQRALDKVA